MAIPKKHLSRAITRSQISGKRFVIGLLLGVCFAFSLYVFISTIRDLVILLSVNDAYELWEVNKEERYVHNLFHAFLASIFGQSVCIQYWFNRSKRVFAENGYRTLGIVHEQRFLNWFFLSWFTRVTTLYALCVTISLFSSLIQDSFLLYYKSLLFLIFVVLFFQSWHSLLFTYRSKAYRWMVISLGVIAIVSLSISNINFIDHDSFYKNVKAHRLEVKYRLNIPFAERYKTIEKNDRLKRIYMLLSREDETVSQPIIYFNKDSVSMDGLSDALIWDSKKDSYFGMGYYQHLVYIDSLVKMKHVNHIQRELVSTDVRFIYYAIKPKQHQFDSIYSVSSYKTGIFMSNWEHPFFQDVDSLSLSSTYQNAIKVHYSATAFLVDGKELNKNQLQVYIKKELQRDSDFIVQLYPSKELSFGHYFKAVIAFHNVIGELRDLKAKEHYGTVYDSLNQEQRIGISSELPNRLTTITSELN